MEEIQFLLIGMTEFMNTETCEIMLHARYDPNLIMKFGQLFFFFFWDKVHLGFA